MNFLNIPLEYIVEVRDAILYNIMLRTQLAETYARLNAMFLAVIIGLLLWQCFLIARKS